MLSRSLNVTDFLKELHKYDACVISCGLMDIIKNPAAFAGYEVYDNLVQIIGVFEALEIDSYIVQLPPVTVNNCEKIADITIFNAQLDSKKPGNTIQTSQCLDLYPTSLLFESDEITLKSTPSKDIAKLLTSQVKPKLKTKSDLKNLSLKIGHDTQNQTQIKKEESGNNRRNDTNFDTNFGSVQDFIKIDETLNGLIIGKGGSNVKNIQKVTGAKAFIKDIEVNGVMTHGVLVRGHTTAAVTAAMNMVKDTIRKDSMEKTTQVKRPVDDTTFPLIKKIR